MVFIDRGGGSRSRAAANGQDRIDRASTRRSDRGQARSRVSAARVADRHAEQANHPFSIVGLQIYVHYKPT